MDTEDSLVIDRLNDLNGFNRFQSSIEGISLPEKFTFPFYYDPHPLCVIAAEELQHHLQTQSHWEHNFGIDPDQKGLVIGKMFGVLVVQTADGQLGYLSAFSGKLADANHHRGFVPPVYDMLTSDGFFNEGAKVLNPINAEIALLEKDPKLIAAKKNLDQIRSKVEEIIKTEKAKLKAAKKIRKASRIEGKDTLDEAAFDMLKKEMIKQSLEDQRDFKAISKYWEIRVFYAELEFNKYQDVIDGLKAQRKAKSNALQKQLFDQYNFLNKDGESKNVIEIFEHTTAQVPPAGSGECAAPKLLQYAFKHGLKPIAIAEFWWGASPKSEVRKHGQFYPACRGKCEPILGHMLKGIDIDDNPMLVNPAIGKTVDIIYEDDVMVVINKPAEMLSVPGKTIEDSVWLRMKHRYPDATGPLIVHRLDMSTSGLLLIAKSKEVHKILQKQFIDRTIEKRYVALLDGIVHDDKGYVNLPLRVDLDDRPRQVVCYEYGKTGRTKWKVIDRKDNQTRIYFFPITGRTHQLRVHAAHHKGLNCPIVGDDLYGQKGERLHLHAEWIALDHPTTGDRMEVIADCMF